MESTTRLDDRGRLTIRRPYRNMLRGRIVQILTPHGVLLRPVPDTLPHKRLPPALTEVGEEEAAREAGR